MSSAGPMAPFVALVVLGEPFVIVFAGGPVPLPARRLVVHRTRRGQRRRLRPDRRLQRPPRRPPGLPSPRRAVARGGRPAPPGSAGDRLTLDGTDENLFHPGMTLDAIIKGGRWFDGTAPASAVRNLGIRDGHVVAVSDEPPRRDRLSRGGRRARPVGAPRASSTSTPTTTSRCSRARASRSRCATASPRSSSAPARSPRSTWARRRRRPVRPGRGHPAPARHRAVEKHQDWTSAEQYVAALESLPLGPEPGGVHRPLRHAHRDHGPGPGHPQGASGRAAASRRAWRRC